MKGFIEFIRNQGVVGFAVGFILGTEVSKLVKSFVDNIVNPFTGLALGFAKNLDKASIKVLGAEILWGNFVVELINFVIIAAVVYLGVKVLRLEKLDAPKVVVESPKKEEKKK